MLETDLERERRLLCEAKARASLAREIAVALMGASGASLLFYVLTIQRCDVKEWSYLFCIGFFFTAAIVDYVWGRVRR